MHQRWNNALVQEVLRFQPRHLLDLCAGTGEIGLNFLRQSSNTQATLLDFCPEMLEVAKVKSPELQDRFQTITGDAQTLPFPENSFDAITIAYGVRNLENRILCFKESQRVLKAGGILAILDLTRPSNFFLRFSHQGYLKFGLPLLGKCIAKNYQAYSYLARSIAQFSNPELLTQELQAEGFLRVKKSSFFGGVATLLVFQKK
jgi:demethylmenaquinone methyltransferase/2-methoxy-6-polyprenyl-1,4-benzoquinol methylase